MNNEHTVRQTRMGKSKICVQGLDTHDTERPKEEKPEGLA